MNRTKFAQASAPPRSAELNGISAHSLVSGYPITNSITNLRLGPAATSSRQQPVAEKHSSLDQALRRGRLMIPQSRVLLAGPA
jgi:hypothetical protein